jgi:hypothetical protein
MPYVVMVDDNFHPQDEDERYELGEFADGAEAIEHCRRIVDGFLESGYKTGMSASELFSHYTTFGEDPFIVSRDAPKVSFSAWDYARERCRELCGGEKELARKGYCAQRHHSTGRQQ